MSNIRNRVFYRTGASVADPYRWYVRIANKKALVGVAYRVEGGYEFESERRWAPNGTFAKLSELRSAISKGLADARKPKENTAVATT